VVEEEPHAAGGLEVLVHHEPDAELEVDGAGEDGEQAVALGEGVLADANAEASAQGRVLADVAVAAVAEQVARDGEVGSRETTGGGDAVEADEWVVQELRERARGALHFQITRVCMEAEMEHTELLGDERGLGWFDHAHGDVGGAAQEIFRAVREHDFDDDARVLFAKGGERCGQDFDADHFAGGDADGAALFLIFAGGGAQEGAGGVGHGFCVGYEGMGVGGRAQSSLRAREERGAERLFQLVDVATDGGLSEPQRARGPREAALTNYRQKRAVKLPAGFGGHYT